MLLWEQLQIRPGVTAILGSGGKTTLLLRLAAELPGRVIVTTTTKIYPLRELPVCDPDTEQELAVQLRRQPCLCVGKPLGEKLCQGTLPIDAVARQSDYVLVEADGAKGLPLKAHLSHEPVIPPGARRILVVGLSGVGQPIVQAAHRPERFAALAGCEVSDPATPARIARVLLAEQYFDEIILNQATGHEDAARELASLLPAPVYAGEIREGKLCLLS